MTPSQSPACASRGARLAGIAPNFGVNVPPRILVDAAALQPFRQTRLGFMLLDESTAKPSAWPPTIWRTSPVPMP